MRRSCQIISTTCHIITRFTYSPFIQHTDELVVLFKCEVRLWMIVFGEYIIDVPAATILDIVNKNVGDVAG